MSKPFKIKLSDAQIAELTKLSTFDGVAIAEEIVAGIKALLATSKRKDKVYRKKVCETLEEACRTLKKLERGDEIIAVFKPLFEELKSKKSRKK